MGLHDVTVTLLNTSYPFITSTSLAQTLRIEGTKVFWSPAAAPLKPKPPARLNSMLEVLPCLVSRSSSYF